MVRTPRRNDAWDIGAFKRACTNAQGRLIERDPEAEGVLRSVSLSQGGFVVVVQGRTQDYSPWGGGNKTF